MNEWTAVEEIEKRAKQSNYLKDFGFEDSYLFGYFRSCLATAIRMMPEETRQRFLQLQGIETIEEKA